jgi:pimeloyl-ACP methyl ester carboxylesterase
MSRVLRAVTVLRVIAIAAAAIALLPRTGAASAPPPSLSHRCGRSVGGTPFWFQAADGVRLDGAVLGGGRTGVVLATEYPADLCNWLPEALVLQKRGFRVFLFDFRGFGLSTQPPAAKQRHFVEDVVGAARVLRARGASRLYLMGASLGATSSIIAATRITPAVAGVVSLSGEANLNGRVAATGLDAETAAKRLKVPVLYVVARGDPLTPPADVARMRAALRSKGSGVHVFAGTFHGWDLLYVAPYRARVDRLIGAFLRR